MSDGQNRVWCGLTRCAWGWCNAVFEMCGVLWAAPLIFTWANAGHPCRQGSADVEDASAWPCAPSYPLACLHPQSPPTPRSHKDLAKDGAPYFRKAKKFYDGLAQELVQHGHIMDIFVCALDQVRASQPGGGGLLDQFRAMGDQAGAAWPCERWVRAAGARQRQVSCRRRLGAS